MSTGKAWCFCIAKHKLYGVKKPFGSPVDELNLTPVPVFNP